MIIISALYNMSKLSIKNHKNKSKTIFINMIDAQSLDSSIKELQHEICKKYKNIYKIQTNNDYDKLLFIDYDMIDYNESIKNDNEFNIE